MIALTATSEWLATTRRYTERSKREYLDDVSDVVEYLEARCRIRSATAVQRQHLAGFLAHCAAAGHAASTRRRSVAAIRAFFAFLVQQGVLRHSPAEYLLPPERETRPPRVLTEAEYTALRGAASDNGRDLAIIELVLQTGLRALGDRPADDRSMSSSPTEPRFSRSRRHVRIAGRGATAAP